MLDGLLRGERESDAAHPEPRDERADVHAHRLEQREEPEQEHQELQRPLGQTGHRDLRLVALPFHELVAAHVDQAQEEPRHPDDHDHLLDRHEGVMHGHREAEQAARHVEQGHRDQQTDRSARRLQVCKTPAG